jgi:hypothetical protein
VGTTVLEKYIAFISWADVYHADRGSLLVPNMKDHNTNLTTVKTSNPICGGFVPYPSAAGVV